MKGTPLSKSPFKSRPLNTYRNAHRSLSGLITARLLIMAERAGFEPATELLAL
jgi:hypothetical protein